MRGGNQSRLTSYVTSAVYGQRSPILGRLRRLLLWVLGIDIPASVEIEPGLRLAHPTSGVVVHPTTKIGRDVTIFHNVTIGRSDAWEADPAGGLTGGVVIEEGVVIGAGAVLLFRVGEVIRIGAYAIIGANSVVTKSVPGNEIWAGNPVKRVRSVTRDAES